MIRTGRVVLTNLEAGGVYVGGRVSFILDPQVSIIAHPDVVVSEVDRLDSIVARVEAVGVQDEGSFLLEKCCVVLLVFWVNVKVGTAKADVPTGTFWIHEGDATRTQVLCDGVHRSATNHKKCLRTYSVR